VLQATFPTSANYGRFLIRKREASLGCPDQGVRAYMSLFSVRGARER
jgi:hypothetical protein